MNTNAKVCCRVLLMTHSCIQVAKVEDIPDGWMGLDNGPESTKMIQVCCSVLQRVATCVRALQCLALQCINGSRQQHRVHQNGPGLLQRVALMCVNGSR